MGVRSRNFEPVGGRVILEDNITREPQHSGAAEPSPEEERRLRPVVDIFSRLSIACKSRSLYPAEHPAAVDALVNLHAVMEASLAASQQIVVRVGRDNLVYEGQVLGHGMESLRALASRVRSLNIHEVFFKAGASLQDVRALVELLLSDPEHLQDAGGPENFLLARGVHSIGVVESEAQRVEDGEEAEKGAGPGIEPPTEMDERLDDATADQALELLRVLLEPEKLGRLLMGLACEDGRPPGKDSLADAIFIFLKNAYEIVRHYFPEREQDCLRGMAESLFFLDGDIRNLVLLRSLFARLREEAVCSRILNQFNAREMADMLSNFFPLVPELTPEAGDLLRAIGFKEGETRHALRLLRARLVDLGQVPPGLLASLEAGTEREKTDGRPSNALPSPEEIIGILGEYRPDEMAEIRAISEFDPSVDTLAEATPMLLDLLGQAEGLDNPGRVVELLQQNFWGLIMSARLGMAAAVVSELQEALRNGNPALEPFLQDLATMLDEAAGDKMLRSTIRLACRGRDDPHAVEGLKAYICELGDRGLSAMLEALGSEEDMSVRKRIVDILVELCGDRIPLLGACLDDPRWYLVRNIVTIMARLRSPDTVHYLCGTLDHPNRKVRAETIRALGLTGGYAACDLLMQGLRDEDERIRILCIRWLGRLQETRAAGYLLKMLEDKEPGADSLSVKKEIIRSLGEIRAPESCDVLRKYLVKQKRLNRSEWKEINQAASEALSRLTEKFPHLERKA